MGVPCRTALAVAGLLALAEPAVVSAQYFGRNKVEYVDFDFRILATEHFDVYYYEREEQAARLAAQLAERWYARFSRVLNHQLITRQPLVLYGSQPEFAQTNVVSGILSDTVGGVTESSKRRIVMPFAPTLAETNRVLGHEIAHAFQFSIGRRHGGSMGLPLWFIEGMAEYLARGASDPEATLWIRDAVWTERLPRRARDAAATLSPYQYGHAFWAYLAGRFGDDVVERALKPPRKRGSMDDRMRAATGSSVDELYADFRTAVGKRYASQPDDLEDMPQTRSLASQAAGRVQLSPALSPDGKFAVFFSERDRLSLDLFLVDVNTGHIVRKLATTAASVRFDSLQPLRAAGAWSPSGDAFAFPAVRQGHGAVIVFDMRRPGHDREIPFADLGQILSATWAPDGQRLALSALAGGLTNLYVYDLAAATLRQLTNDPYTDLQPAWSPDGRQIAFATDRYSTDLDRLAFGPTKLAVIDVASAAVREVSAVPSAHGYINPQWTTDGRALYCIANLAEGSNVFRIDLTSGAHHQLTDVKTGVTGLTPTSPALSVATNAATAAFTVYGNRSYAVTVLDGDAALAGQPFVARAHAEAAADGDGEAPNPTAGVLAQVLADSLTGLPAPDTMRVRDYTPRLALERIGQPYVSSGGGAFGTFVRGGGSFLFGDMLGQRRLGAAVQIANRMRDAAFELRYLNQSQRWNWGAIAELEPALRRYRSTAAIDHEGQPALLRQADYLERIQLYGAGVLAYPFSRGLRLEVIGGVRHASYHRDVRSQISSLETGRVLEQVEEQSSGGVPTTVAEVGTALVGDTTVFGPTGPLLGSRFRFEVAPATGDLTYTRVLADYRRYLMPVRPYTVALRVLHSARYGRDGDDPRLLPSFLGSRYLVRGHSTDARDCQPDPGRVCGAELLGSRLLVGNVELRAPVWGLLKGQLEYGPLPLDAFLFGDSGVVWSRRPQDALSVARRTVINSLGIGVRLNAGGLPFEIAAVRALDGPSPGWSFDFGFRTGF
jgi:WD40-like Beta Propeller Repeat/Peptidase of plants and bacteria